MADTMNWIPAAILVWMVALGTAGGQEFHGRIVDAENRPAAGVVLSPQWQFFDPTVAADKIEPASGQPSVTTDDDGRFVIDRETADRKDWLALDATRTTGVLLRAEELEGPNTTFTLVPLVSVRGNYEIKAAGSMPESIGSWARRRLARNPVAFCESWSEHFAFKLPPEEYLLFYSNGDLDHRIQMPLTKRFEVEPGVPAIDLGGVHLKLPRVIRITGRVLGPDGEPAADVEVARIWDIGASGMTSSHSVTTGGDGGFVRREALYGKQILLMALDGERELGGLVRIGGEQSETVTIRMEPLVEVSGQIRLKGSRQPLRQPGVVFTTREGHLTVARCLLPDGNFSARLPPGRYLVYYEAEGAEIRGEYVTLDSKKKSRNLGRIALKPSVLTRKAGRRAPALHVSDARGIDPGIDLDDLRGKWIAIEFWAHWCGPCVQDGLPRLTRLYRKYADKRDRFEVLAQLVLVGRPELA